MKIRIPIVYEATFSIDGGPRETRDIVESMDFEIPEFPGREFPVVAEYGSSRLACVKYRDGQFYVRLADGEAFWKEQSMLHLLLRRSRDNAWVVEERLGPLLRELGVHDGSDRWYKFVNWYADIDYQEIHSLGDSLTAFTALGRDKAVAETLAVYGRYVIVDGELLLPCPEPRIALYGQNDGQEDCFDIRTDRFLPARLAIKGQTSDKAMWYETLFSLGERDAAVAFAEAGLDEGRWTFPRSALSEIVVHRPDVFRFDSRTDMLSRSIPYLVAATGHLVGGMSAEAATAWTDLRLIDRSLGSASSPETLARAFEAFRTVLEDVGQSAKLRPFWLVVETLDALRSETPRPSAKAPAPGVSP